MRFKKIILNKIIFFICAIPFSGSLIFHEKVFALTGREIMEKVNARDAGNRSISDMEMILLDKKGKKRVLVYIHPATGQSYGQLQHESTPDFSREINTNSSWAASIVKAHKSSGSRL